MPHPARTPLGQALAAIIAILIAALAEHAAEHPVLAPGLRATIRQLEQIARRFDAMVAEWQATRDRPPRAHPRTRSLSASCCPLRRPAAARPCAIAAIARRCAPPSRAPPHGGVVIFARLERPRHLPDGRRTHMRGRQATHSYKTTIIQPRASRRSDPAIGNA